MKKYRMATDNLIELAPEEIKKIIKNKKTFIERGVVSHEDNEYWITIHKIPASIEDVRVDKKEVDNLLKKYKESH